MYIIIECNKLFIGQSRRLKVLYSYRHPTIVFFVCMLVCIMVVVTRRRKYSQQQTIYSVMSSILLVAREKKIYLYCLEFCVHGTVVISDFRNTNALVTLRSGDPMRYFFLCIFYLFLSSKLDMVKSKNSVANVWRNMVSGNRPQNRLYSILFR